MSKARQPAALSVGLAVTLAEAILFSAKAILVKMAFAGGAWRCG